MPRSWLPLLALLLPVSLATAAADAPPSEIAGFFREHCLDCHGRDERKGGLNLEQLPADFADRQTADLWIDVFDQLSAGRMPPKDEPRPPAAELARTSAWIKQHLLAAEARSRRSGRVVLRRLNRVEYENSVRDLFGVVTRVRDMLPEDQQAGGFDNVGAALQVSSVLLERYLDAADLVLADVFQHGKRPEVRKVRYPFKGDSDAAQRAERILVERDDGIVAFSSGYCPTEMRKLKITAAGPYRVRVFARAWQTRKPVTFAVYVGQLFRPGGRKSLAGYFDVGPGAAKPVELSAWLEPGDTLKCHPYGIGYRIYEIGAKNYKDAGLFLEAVELEGPLHEHWPTTGFTNMFGTLDLAKGTIDDARRALAWAVPRALRRPASEADIGPYLAIAKTKLGEGATFEKAMRVALKALLTSPEFLFLREAPGNLDGHALAARLSYFLWSSLPDDALRTAADSGKLRAPAALRAQVERMLADAKGERFTENFCGQWLGLRLIDFTTPDMMLYPEYDELLGVSMVRETQAFFDEVLRTDASLLSFLTSDWTILNERLARHYGIAGVSGQKFRRVELSPGSHRGGVLSMAGVLKITANGTNTSPVTRGAWVARNIVGDPPKPPPPNVPAIEPDIRGATTIRDQLAKHRTIELCSSCHVKIDPLGNALENFDVVGAWRERYRTTDNKAKGIQIFIRDKRVYIRQGAAVDPHDTLADGRSFAGIDEFKQLLASEPDRFTRVLAEKLLTYATGGEPTFADRDAVAAIVARVRIQRYGFRSLLHEVVASPTFRSK